MKHIAQPSPSVELFAAEQASSERLDGFRRIKSEADIAAAQANKVYESGAASISEQIAIARASFYDRVAQLPPVSRAIYEIRLQDKSPSKTLLRDVDQKCAEYEALSSFLETSGAQPVLEAQRYYFDAPSSHLPETHRVNFTNKQVGFRFTVGLAAQAPLHVERAPIAKPKDIDFDHRERARFLGIMLPTAVTVNTVLSREFEHARVSELAGTRTTAYSFRPIPLLSSEYEYTDDQINDVHYGETTIKEYPEGKQHTVYDRRTVYIGKQAVAMGLQKWEGRYKERYDQATFLAMTNEVAKFL